MFISGISLKKDPLPWYFNLTFAWFILILFTLSLDDSAFDAFYGCLVSLLAK